MAKVRPTREFLGSEEWGKFEREMEASDDRSCVLLGAAYLDVCLAVLLENALPGRGQIGELLDNYGPLSSFASRIKMASALQLIPATLVRDLELINRIRNEFAHGLHGMTLSESSVRDRCLGFNTPRELLEWAGVDVGELLGSDPRKWFTMAVGIMVSMMEDELLTLASEVHDSIAAAVARH